MRQEFFIICILLLLSSASASAQAQVDYFYKYRRRSNLLQDGIPSIYNRNDSQLLLLGICKNYSISLDKANAPFGFQTKDIRKSDQSVFSIHGNVRYDFISRSFVETPAYQNDLKQHIVSTQLRIQVSRDFPITVNLSTRTSNSPFFKNYLDVDLGFDKHNFIKGLKEEFIKKKSESIIKASGLRIIQESLNLLEQRIRQLKDYVSYIDPSGDIILSRERINDTNIQSKFSTNVLPNNVAPAPENRLRHLRKLISSDNYEEYSKQIKLDEKKQYDSLLKVKDSLTSHYESILKRTTKQIALLKEKVIHADGGELENLYKQDGEPGSRLKWALLKLQKLRVGRSMVNYSELTAWNIMVTGLNAEFNARFYAAFVGGKVDFGLRDFLGNHNRNSHQTMSMARFGYGNKDRNALIFSIYSGTKYQYGSLQTLQRTGNVNVLGYSLEVLLKNNNKSSLSFEVAKSTEPTTASQGKGVDYSALWNLRNSRNLGISIKGDANIRPTHTKLSGFIRKSGAAFQSFSLYNYNSDQFSWNVRMDQPLFHRNVQFTAMLRRNDFVSPFTEKTFKSSTIFKSFSLNVRLPKWPLISMGYNPGTQVFVVDKDHIREYAYHTITGSLLYNYRLSGAQMMSSLIYNQYVSRGTDSGFINYSGKNYLLNQTLNVKNLTLLGSVTYTDQENLKYHTLSSGLGYVLTNKVRISGHVRNSKIINGKSNLGGQAHCALTSQSFGELSLQYDKSFLPTIRQTLFPVESGRISWVKFF